MTLRKRALLAGVATIALLLAVPIALGREILLPSFSNLEERDTRKNVDRVRDALTGRLNDLNSKAGDWAHWDDTYRFIRDRNRDYVETNLTDDALRQLRINMLVLSDSSGRIVQGKAFDLGRDTAVPLPRSLEQHLASDVVRRRTGANGHVVGTILLPEGPLLIAVRAILTSEGKGPTRGVLMMGRYLDGQEIESLEDMTHLSVAMRRIDDPLLPRDFSEARTSLAGKRRTFVQPLSAKKVAGYALLADIYGRHALMFRVDVPRDVYEQGQATLSYYLLSLFGVGLTFGLVLAWLLETQVLSRLARLSRTVRDIGATGNIEARVSMPGRDELTSLAGEINNMLGALGKSQDALRDARDQLDARVQERTADLKESNDALLSEIDEHRKAAEALRRSEEQHRLLVENMADAVLTTDIDGRFAFASPQAATLTGHAVGELRGMSYKELVAEESVPGLERELGKVVKGETVRPQEATILHAGGRPIPVEVSPSAVRSPQGDITGIQWIARDITERKRFEARLVHMANRDHLTGLFNRRSFDEELQRELAETVRQGGQGALLWLDLDDFKGINDSLGHRVGDELLIGVANMLQERVRRESVLARLGGDEFAVILPNADLAQAEAAATRLLKRIRTSHFVVGGRMIRVSTSIGIVLFPEHGTTVEELLSRADLAMYHAKEYGRDRYCTYAPGGEWDAEIKSRVAWAERVDDALKYDLFQTYAQPILDLKTNEIASYELLIRMVGDEGEIVLAGTFLNAAERLGLVSEIDRLMVRRAIRLMADEHRAGREVHLDVNLSGKAFSDEKLLPIIEEELGAAGIDPAWLGLEITETVAISDMGKAQEFIGSLNKLGCRFALDDFGSGFSWFYYLKNLPIDCLKIDGSFIQNVSRSSEDQHLVKAIVELSRGLGMKTTAEYVEDEETLQLLREYGVDYGQGYHIRPPGPVAEVLEGRLKAA